MLTVFENNRSAIHNDIIKGNIKISKEADPAHMLLTQGSQVNFVLKCKMRLRGEFRNLLFPLFFLRCCTRLIAVFVIINTPNYSTIFNYMRAR